MKQIPLDFPNDVPAALHSIINQSVSPEPKNRPSLREIKLILNRLTVSPDDCSFSNLCTSNVKNCTICRLTECKCIVDLHNEFVSVQNCDSFFKIPEMELLINSEIIASGRTADIYAGSWDGLDIAIKVIRMSDVESQRRLKRELLKLSVLNHPSIIRVFGMTYRDGGKLGIVMERASHSLRVGTSLNATTLSHAIAVVNAVKFLHSKDIIHGDIKPGNILIVNGVVKLSDFGSAKYLYETSSTASFHHTPKYAPPEVFDTVNDVLTKESDVYSLGMVLYEILCGKSAYEGLTSSQIFGVKMKQIPLDFPNDVPAALHSIINQSVSPEPKNRPSLREIKLILNDMLSLVNITTNELSY
ncbi:hypothetical protein GEMRC1_001963 [Eukaryota sp. GEM-RC1]